MSAEDILFEPVVKKIEPPKEEAPKFKVHQFHFGSGGSLKCLKCGLGLMDYMYDSTPCSS